MKMHFENEGEEFRDFVANNPDFVVILRHADGSVDIASGEDIVQEE